MADYIHEMRALVGHRPMILNTAAGALLNEQHQLLLQERADTGDWSFPGGYMEFGASFMDTCKREYLEDAGLEVEPIKLLKLFDKDFYTYPNGDQTQLITALYLVKQTGGALLDHVTDETTQLKYFDLDNLPKLFNDQSVKMAQAVIDEVVSWQTVEQHASQTEDQPILLHAENINQYAWGMPNGCEPAALLTGLHLKGYALDKDYLTIIDEMPKAADYNPYHGFGGAPDENVPGHFEAIFPEPLVKWAQQYGKVRDICGANIDQIKAEIAQKNPVVAYVTVGFEAPETAVYSFGEALANNHAVLVDGYFGDRVHISDPIDGTYWLSDDRFKQAYDARHWAVVID